MTLPMFVDALVKIRHEELHREAEYERLARIARSWAGDHQRRFTIVALAARAAAAVRAARRVPSAAAKPGLHP